MCCVSAAARCGLHVLSPFKALTKAGAGYVNAICLIQYCDDNEEFLSVFDVSKVEEFEIYCLIWFSFMERAHDLFLAILFMRGRESQYSVYAG